MQAEVRAEITGPGADACDARAAAPADAPSRPCPAN